MHQSIFSCMTYSGQYSKWFSLNIRRKNCIRFFISYRFTFIVTCKPSDGICIEYEDIHFIFLCEHGTPPSNNLLRLSRRTTPPRKATKSSKRPQVSIPPIRKSDGSWAKSDIERAAVFGDHLRQVFIPHSSFHSYDLVISASLEVPCPMSLPITPFSPAECWR